MPTCGLAAGFVPRKSGPAKSPKSTEKGIERGSRGGLEAIAALRLFTPFRCRALLAFKRGPGANTQARCAIVNSVHETYAPPI